MGGGLQPSPSPSALISITGANGEHKTYLRATFTTWLIPLHGVISRCHISSPTACLNAFPALSAALGAAVLLRPSPWDVPEVGRVVLEPQTRCCLGPCWVPPGPCTLPKRFLPKGSLLGSSHKVPCPGTPSVCNLQEQPAPSLQ